MRIIKWWESICIFHVWGKWQQYQCKGNSSESNLIDYIRQHRACEHCGHYQDKLLYKGRKLQLGDKP